MQPIHSGSTTERVVRTSIVTVMALAAAAYCFYDGYVGYPRENLKRAVQELSPQPERSPRIVPQINAKGAGGVERGTPLADLKARWGEPGWRHRDEARWFGPGGQLVVTLRDEQVLKTDYQAARYKTETDLMVQKVMGIVVGAAALILLIHWLRVFLIRTTLTDEGVKTSGRPLVPFEAMQGLRAEHFARKGWVDIEYVMDGRTGTIRLDDYGIKDFPTIMEEICRRKGYENPYTKWQAEKASRGLLPPSHQDTRENQESNPNSSS